MIYLDKEHDTNKKYQEYDEVLTPLVVFLNNILDYQGKIRIMKEYGFKEMEREVREVCDYANILEKEYLNKYKDVEVNPHMTFKEAYTICYEYQKDKIKDSTLKTYGERIKYMGLLDNVELVNLD